MELKDPRLGNTSCNMTSKESINRFFFANYVLMLINLIGFAVFAGRTGIGAALFTIAVMFAYAYVYMIPTGILLSLTRAVTVLLKISDRLYAKLFLYAVAVLAVTMTHLIIQVDRIVFNMYGFHFNGFIWTLLTTKGGFEALGCDRITLWTFAAVILGIIFFESIVLVLCIRWKTLKVSSVSKIPHYLKITMPYTAVAMFAVQGMFYGVSSFYGNKPVLTVSGSFPFYVPITFQSALHSMGLESDRRPVFTVGKPENLALRYPLKEIRQRPGAARYNIVWLVAESWRADMLTEEIMPQTWKFAQKAQHFVNHYSAGNGTRKAMFGMFYGLYGNYWPNFLNEQRSPVLMDMLVQNDYQIDLYTSARFTYPELDKTVFSGIPAQQMHENVQPQSWKSDRKNVTELLNFIDSCDKEKLFMTFLFFDSPHAHYYFPPECVIRTDYLKDFNYLTVDVKKDIDKIFNRYINSCNHLDTQVARIVGDLEKKSLLDTTIVIIVGDHGEEFMEHGRWGHSSSFVDQQLRVPMVMWIPGMEPGRHTKITSHLDIPATVMQIFGVKNPPQDYSLGMDMFSEQKRQYTVFSDWDSIVYRDSDCKIVIPLKGSAVSNEVTTADDKPIEDSSAVLSEKTGMLIQVLNESEKFTEQQ